MKNFLTSAFIFTNVQGTSSININVTDFVFENLQTGTVSGSIMDLLNRIQPMQTNRISLPAVTPFDLKNYGCYCTGTNWNFGRASPKDQYDKICMNQNKAYHCLVQDAENNADFCDPVTEEYEFEVAFDASALTLSVTCQEENLTTFCKRNKCLIDLRSIYDAFTLQQNFIYPDIDFLGHIGEYNGRGTFEPETTCVQSGSIGSSELHSYQKTCCGDYPLRSWFLSNEQNYAHRECCEYNDLNMQLLWNDSNLKAGKFYHTDFQSCCTFGVKTYAAC